MSERDEVGVKKRTIRGVVFDMDGTLCVSAALDFTEMRRRVGCATADILGEVDSWDAERRAKAYEIIGEMEREALRTTTIMPGAVDVAATLDEMKIPRALVTRNAASSVDFFHDEVWSIAPFSPWLSREFKPYKPAPDALLHICEKWGCSASEIIMVGDSAKDDVVSGNRAGAITVLLDSGRTKKWSEEFGVDKLAEEMTPHFICANMSELQTLLTQSDYFEFAN
ncbi:HAD hydrolase, subfamily IA [Ostreococcus tauri]|uniref:HAD hydrolase, subfamily IA n=1 Tax=Ostreococcus tauri TaxID=70448 RepID=Q014M1_OSTTA|nr:HAD hydrolase, subfamily IA [Ostreococcus tauri]OUS47249.1 haloacid dehalogenase-like hydrolase-like protein [Ostreococcus tauri]CAL54658.1 HAD hydrolase, subfamily IA [Ostreococcus tauri]|eukprot:XP_003080491.1 HAD hydrolase, subfamily IA [Ostreococcus tauri]